jgi:hypothetical protein
MFPAVLAHGLYSINHQVCVCTGVCELGCVWAAGLVALLMSLASWRGCYCSGTSHCASCFPCGVGPYFQHHFSVLCVILVFCLPQRMLAIQATAPAVYVARVHPAVCWTASYVCKAFLCDTHPVWSTKHGADAGARGPCHCCAGVKSCVWLLVLKAGAHQRYLCGLQ